jgi:hypothetical protein
MLLLFYLFGRWEPMPYPVIPVPAPAREMKWSVRESRHNYNALGVNCLYPLNLLRMNLLAEFIPWWESKVERYASRHS